MIVERIGEQAGATQGFFAGHDRFGPKLKKKSRRSDLLSHLTPRPEADRRAEINVSALHEYALLLNGSRKCRSL